MPRTTRLRNNKLYEIVSPKYLELPLGLFDKYIFPVPETNIKKTLDFGANHEIITSKIVVDEQDILDVWKRIDVNYFEAINYNETSTTRINEIAKEYPNNWTTTENGQKKITCICGEILQYLYRVSYKGTYVIIGIICIEKFNDTDMLNIAKVLKLKHDIKENPSLYCLRNDCMRKTKSRCHKKCEQIIIERHSAQLKNWLSTTRKNKKLRQQREAERDRYFKKLIRKIDTVDDRKCEIIDDLYSRRSIREFFVTKSNH